jgi:hypothetical protein
MGEDDTRYTPVYVIKLNVIFNMTTLITKTFYDSRTGASAEHSVYTSVCNHVTTKKFISH